MYLFYELRIFKTSRIGEVFIQGTEVDPTVALKQHQGSFRHRAVFDGGALFSYFLGKQKVTTITIEVYELWKRCFYFSNESV